MKLSLLTGVLFCPLLASAQLAVTVSPVKVAGQKAIVPLAMKNNFAEKIESARAAVFLLDEQGKMIGQATKWVIGGSRDKPGLAAGATNAFHFVIAADKPFTTTNLTAKVTFNRVVLAGGKLADASKAVTLRAILCLQQEKSPRGNWRSHLPRRCRRQAGRAAGRTFHRADDALFQARGLLI